MERKRKRLVYWLSVALAASSAGCVTTQRIEERSPRTADEVAEVGVAVVSAAPFELYVKDLSPDFNIDAEVALKLVGASTRLIEDSMVRSTQALTRLTPELRSSQRTTTSRTDAAGVTSASAAASSAVGPGDLSTVAAPGIPADALPAAMAASAPSGFNPILQYQLANALIQEVRLLNDYVRRAPRAKDHSQYIVRLQLSVQQKGRNTPFDAITDLDFQLNDAACRAGSAVRAIPLLVHDNIDISSASAGTRRVSAVGLALSGLRSNIGFGFDVGTRTEQLLRALGSEFNPVLSVGQAPGSDADSRIRVRVGAVEKGVDRHELVTRSYMVTVLLLVPNVIVGATSEMAEECASAVQKRLEDQLLAATAGVSRERALSDVKAAFNAGRSTTRQADAKAAGSTAEDGSSVPFASLRVRASTSFEHARSGSRVEGTTPGSLAAVELWSWPKPRFPPEQLTRVVLSRPASSTAGPYTGTVQLRGGDALVDRLLDRACLRASEPVKTDGKTRAKVCEGSDALLADKLKVLDGRDGIEAQFTDRLGLKDSKTVAFGDKNLTHFCYEYMDAPNPTRGHQDKCMKLQAPVDTNAREAPRLRATVKVSVDRLIADNKAAASLAVSVEFDEGKGNPNLRPDTVKLDISGASLAEVRPVSGQAKCATQAPDLVFLGNCAVILELTNVAPGRLVRLSATAKQGKDKSNPLNITNNVLEVMLRPAELALVPLKAP